MSRFEDLRAVASDEPEGVELDLFTLDGGTILIKGLELADLDASDFVFADTGPGEKRIGTAGDDTLTGTTGHDTLDGLGGDDSLSGGEGNDLLIGGEGGDTLWGATGNDTLLGGDGIDSLDGGPGDDVLNPGDNQRAYDWISASQGNDTIVYTDNETGFQDLFYGYFFDGIEVSIDGVDNVATVDKGSAGSDTLVDIANPLGAWGFGVHGTAFDDVFNLRLDEGDWISAGGDSGNDTFSIEGAGFVHLDYATAANGIVADLGTGLVADDGHGDVDTIYGRVDQVAGSFRSDSIIGGDHDERFVGRGGNDSIDGGDGFDTLRFDYAQVGHVRANLAAGTARGTWDNEAFAYHITNIEALWGSPGNDSLAGTGGAEELRGNDGNDHLLGRGGDDTIDGGAGKDVAHGGTGNDRLEGGAGNDRLSGNEGDDTIDGGAGRDTLLGATGDDVLRGGAGNDVHWGGTGDDSMEGGEGDDRFSAQHGDDTVDGGAGEDFLAGGAGNDRLHGGDDDDRLFGQAGDDSLEGGAGADVLIAGNGNDTLDGGAGADSFFAQAGDDRLIGGAGDDVLRGQAGDDVFVFAAGHGADTIADFSDGSDLIDLTAFALGGFEAVSATAVGAGVRLDLSDTGGGTVVLKGFNIDDLDAGDFLF